MGFFRMDFTGKVTKYSKFFGWVVRTEALKNSDTGLDPNCIYAFETAYGT